MPVDRETAQRITTTPGHVRDVQFKNLEVFGQPGKYLVQREVPTLQCRFDRIPSPDGKGQQSPAA
jgi:hypothetical protein